MCDEPDGRNDVERREVRRARRPHTCYGCDELIAPGLTYVFTAVLYDGHWDTWKHCRRCDAMLLAIHDASRHDVAVDPGLNCGLDWEDVIGELPDHVAALAFWLPGEPLPYEDGATC